MPSDMQAPRFTSPEVQETFSQSSASPLTPSPNTLMKCELLASEKRIITKMTLIETLAEDENLTFTDFLPANPTRSDVASTFFDLLCKFFYHFYS